MEIVNILYLNNKVIGVFDEDNLNYFIKGGIQNNFFTIENIKTESFFFNSCYNNKKTDELVLSYQILKEVIPKNNDEQHIKETKENETKENETKEKETKENETKEKERIITILEKIKLKNDIKVKELEKDKSDEYKKIQQEKIDLNSKINELKYEKKKLEDFKNEYKNDLKLYEIFCKEKLNNENFVIPELFTLKFGIFDKLNNSNNLSFENYKEEYNKVKPKNNYDMFTNNPYENSFEIENKPLENFEMNFTINL
jgi:hypothetical protein